MTISEIEQKIIWDDNGIGRFTLWIPALQREVRTELFSENYNHPKVTERMAATVQDVLNLPDTAVEKIRQLLWEDCLFSFATTDYGYIRKPDEPDEEALLNTFGIQSRDDIYSPSMIDCIQIPADEGEFTSRFALIIIDSVTDHLLCIIIKNGKIIDYDEAGTFLGWFEKDEQYAHHAREKCLKGEF